MSFKQVQMRKKHKERKQHDEILNTFSTFSPVPVHHPSITQMDDNSADKDDDKSASSNP